MNANSILNEEMTLDEKLAAIDAALANAVVNAQKVNTGVPIDPSEFTMCEGCQ